MDVPPEALCGGNRDGLRSEGIHSTKWTGLGLIPRMGETISIRPADLLINGENPRLPDPNLGQREAQRELAHDQGRKLLVLAKDIVEHGLSPADLPIVIPARDDLKRYIVLEGNRRLGALKALENPEWLVGTVDDVVLREMRELSRQYQETPVESVTCFMVKDRGDADHWIMLRHTGQNEGAGVVPWGSDETARFQARTRKPEIHSQALNFLEHLGALTPKVRRKVPATSYKRLLGTPEVRAKVGIELEDGEMKVLGDTKRVARALLYIANDLIRGTTKTKDIYARDQRVEYANNLPPDIVVTPTRKNGNGITTGGLQTQGRPQRTKGLTRAKARNQLIPRDCVLAVSDQRVREIETELRHIPLDDFPNAVSVLFRVFVELSVDSYISTSSLPQPPKDNLRNKMGAVLKDLLERTKLTREQAIPVRRAMQKGSFLAPSIDLMHNYVHNQYVFPAPGDLRADWNSLQPFIVAIWSP